MLRGRADNNVTIKINDRAVEIPDDTDVIRVGSLIQMSKLNKDETDLWRFVVLRNDGCYWTRPTVSLRPRANDSFIIEARKPVIRRAHAA